MKRIALVILLVVSAFACGKDNNSEARYALDGNGCLINAFDYDWTATSISGQGLQTVNYVWQCADYVNLLGVPLTQKQVTLTFEGAACLQLTSEMVLTGYCTGGANPVQ
jgi:hypothetical protein